MSEPDKTVIKLKETVTIKKFDHTHEDRPTEPVEVLVRESITEISEAEAALLGFRPLSHSIDATETIQFGDSLEVQVDDAQD